MKKRIENSLIVTVLVMLLAAGCGKSVTTQTTTPLPAAVKDSIAQVWIDDDRGGTKTFEALGVAVGDGTTVLTVIDYEDFTPGEAEVRTQNNKTFSATIQTIDARTGATLLKLDSGSLPPVATRDPATLQMNEQLFIWGLIYSDPVPALTNIIGPNIPPDTSAFDFKVTLPESTPDNQERDVARTQGAVVVDQSGKVLGLESVFGNSFITIFGPIGLFIFPAIISIDNLNELLLPNANDHLWSNGPILFAANMITGTAYQNLHGVFEGTNRDYFPVAAAIAQVLRELGGPLSITDLTHDFSYYTMANENTNWPDGSLLTTVFPKPVNLCNADGTVLAQAKWVGIQWDRSNSQPNRVVYGSTAYTVEGSFEITGETASLAGIMLEMINNPNGQ
jgi:uncharacterized protein YceK